MKPSLIHSWARVFQVGHNIKTKNCERGGSEEKAIAETMSAYLIELRIC